MTKTLEWLLRGFIWTYRHSFSMLLGRQCRFLPTCSDYADEAIRLYGPMEGSKLALRRVCRCHPWGGQGFDPVQKTEGRNQVSERHSSKPVV